MPNTLSAVIDEFVRQMVVNELTQALEFDEGKRDHYFSAGGDLPLMRRGAVNGCIRTALSYLTNRGTTLKRQRQEHWLGICGDQCPTCEPREYT